MRAEEAEAETHDHHLPAHAPPQGGAFCSRPATRQANLPWASGHACHRPAVENEPSTGPKNADKYSLHQSQGQCGPRR